MQEILSAVTPIEEREATPVIARIELAAAFLANACSAAYDGAVATSSAENGPTLYSVAEQLVVRRAREIYGQSA